MIQFEKSTKRKEGKQMKAKKILTVQDLSCYGQCSLTVALPILSALKIETIALPTAVLSTHTMFPSFVVKDLTDQILPFKKHWEQQNISFDALYTGYMASADQIDKVLKLKTLLNKE